MRELKATRLQGYKATLCVRTKAHVIGSSEVGCWHKRDAIDRNHVGGMHKRDAIAVNPCNGICRQLARDESKKDKLVQISLCHLCKLLATSQLHLRSTRPGGGAATKAPKPLSRKWLKPHRPLHRAPVRWPSSLRCGALERPWSPLRYRCGLNNRLCGLWRPLERCQCSAKTEFYHCACQCNAVPMHHLVSPNCRMPVPKVNSIIRHTITKTQPGDRCCNQFYNMFQHLPQFARIQNNF